MRFKNLAVAVCVLGFTTATSFAQEKYEIDRSHSNIGFTIRHMVVAKMSGGFKDFSGTIIYDEKDITNSSVNVIIKSASINTQHDRRDSDLRGENFFNTATDSLITFVSKKIEKQGEGYVAIGDLTIRGVTKEVELPFKILGKIEDSRSKRLGIEAGMTINRFDYGVKWDRAMDNGSLVVDKDVEINLNVEAVMRKQ